MVSKAGRAKKYSVGLYFLHSIQTELKGSGKRKIMDYTLVEAVVLCKGAIHFCC